MICTKKLEASFSSGYLSSKLRFANISEITGQEMISPDDITEEETKFKISSSLCPHCQALKRKQLGAANQPISWDDIKNWKEGLNWSQMQHALDPNRLESMLSMILVQTPWEKLSDALKKKFAIAYGFRHEHDDMTPVLGFDMQKNENIWWDTFTISMRQHIIDPHQIFTWSLVLCSTLYKDLKGQQKRIVHEAYALRHKEDSGGVVEPRQENASGSDVYKNEDYVCPTCHEVVKIDKKSEHDRIHKTSSTADSEISKAKEARQFTEKPHKFLSEYASGDPKYAEECQICGSKESEPWHNKKFTPAELGYVEGATPKQCVTCSWFKNPNICNYKNIGMDIPVKAIKGCCNEWRDKTGKTKTEFEAKAMFASLESMSDDGQYATYFLLAGDQVNGRGWGVTEASIPRNIQDFKDKPFVVTTADWIKDSPYGHLYDHPSTDHFPVLGIARKGTYNVNDKNLIFAFQDKFKVGTIVDVYYKDGVWRANVKKEAAFKDMPWPPFCSPAIYKENPHELDGSIETWTALHLAGLDARPAYGNIAILKGTCSGPYGTCSHQLRTASNSQVEFLAKMAMHKINLTLSKWKFASIPSYRDDQNQDVTIEEDTDEGEIQKTITPFREILKNVI